MAENYTSFLGELQKLCTKYGVLLGGKLRVLDHHRYLPNQEVHYKDVIVDGFITDRTGPFIFLSAKLKEVPALNGTGASGSYIIIDKDKPLSGGVVNPLDGKKYDTRHKWDETLKKNNCRQSESSAPEKRQIRPEDMKGNYNVRKELTEATAEVLHKRGLK